MRNSHRNFIIVGKTRRRLRGRPLFSFYHVSFNIQKQAFEQFADSTQGLRIAVFVDDLPRRQTNNLS